jgi:uncharacterized protein Yka (UPF0111/DUF47 family)
MTKVQEGMAALLLFVSDPKPEFGAAVLRLEEEADDLRKAVVDELNKAFVTPIDREDIYALSRAVDDILDYGKSTVDEMLAFEVEPTKHMRLMAAGLSDMATSIAVAIELLTKDPTKAYEKVLHAKKRENYVEHCYREALVDLFKTDNVVTILKVREIYRHMSNAADKGDEAANILGNIMVKSM